MNSTSITGQSSMAQHRGARPARSRLLEFAALAAFCHPGRPWKRVRMLARCLFWPRQTRAWISFLQLGNWLHDLACRDPRLFEKVHRPYLRADLDIGQRLRRLTEHYSLIGEYFDTDRLYAMHAGSALTLATTLDRNGDLLELTLAAVGRNEKEGEMGLVWAYRGDAEALAQLSFSMVVDEQGSPMLFIGGLQGRRGLGAREHIRSATRCCDGLRPKSALAAGVIAFGNALGVARILAVSDACHVSRSVRVRRHVSASYDAFWNELGARPTGSGEFELPMLRRSRILGELKAHKRSESRRRYHRIEQLEAQVVGAVAALRGVAEAPP